MARITKAKLRNIKEVILRRSGLNRHLAYTKRISINGFPIFIPLIEGEGETLLYMERGFKSQLLEKISGIARTDFFIDVGANVGQTMLEVFMDNRQVQYFGFEPNPLAFQMLHRIARVNKIKASLFPWACSSTARPTRIFKECERDSAATILPEIRPDTYENTPAEWVASFPLDMTVKEIVLPKHFVLKIDTEGAELEVLRGATETITAFRPVIFCEVLHAHRESELELNDSHKRSVETFLALNSYSIYLCELSHHGGTETLSGLKRIATFPRGIWSESPYTCDYIFIPLEAENFQLTSFR